MAKENEMITAENDTYTFEHNGFSCRIIERPDLCYCKQPFGRKGELDWMPRVDGCRLYFDKELTFEQVQSACISIMDTGKFEGELERYGDMLVCVEIKNKKEKEQNNEK